MAAVQALCRSELEAWCQACCYHVTDSAIHDGKAMALLLVRCNAGSVARQGLQEQAVGPLGSDGNPHRRTNAVDTVRANFMSVSIELTIGLLRGNAKIGIKKHVRHLLGGVAVAVARLSRDGISYYPVGS